MYLLLLGVQLQVPDPKEEKPVPEGHPISKPQPVPARTSLPLPLPAKGGWRLAVTWLWERRDWRGFGWGRGLVGRPGKGRRPRLTHVPLALCNLRQVTGYLPPGFSLVFEQGTFYDFYFCFFSLHILFKHYHTVKLTCW